MGDKRGEQFGIGGYRIWCKQPDKVVVLSLVLLFIYFYDPHCRRVQQAHCSLSQHKLYGTCSIFREFLLKTSQLQQQSTRCTYSSRQCLGLVLLFMYFSCPKSRKARQGQEHCCGFPSKFVQKYHNISVFSTAIRHFLLLCGATARPLPSSAWLWGRLPKTAGPNPRANGVHPVSVETEYRRHTRKWSGKRR